MSKILIIDNDSSLRGFVEHALKDEGYEIETAPDANDFFERLEAAELDLVLLDLSLPGVSGYDILKEIRKDPRYDTIAIVLFSTKSDTDAKIKGLDLGAADYLVKPIHHQELAARVRALIRQKKRHDELLT